MLHTTPDVQLHGKHKGGDRAALPSQWGVFPQIKPVGRLPNTPPTFRTKDLLSNAYATGPPRLGLTSTRGSCRNHLSTARRVDLPRKS